MAEPRTRSRGRARGEVMVLATVERCLNT